MPQEAGLTAMAHAIQLALTPVFLLLGLGTLLAVMLNRLARIVDRARILRHQATQGTSIGDAVADESAYLARRGRLVSRSIALLTAAALLISAVVAVLFAGTLLDWNMAGVVAGLFIAAMAAVFVGLVLFLREVFLATAALHLTLTPIQPATHRSIADRGSGGAA